MFIKQLGFELKLIKKVDSQIVNQFCTKISQIFVCKNPKVVPKK